MAPLLSGANAESCVVLDSAISWRCFFVFLGLSAEGKGLGADKLERVRVCVHFKRVKVLCFVTDP